MYAESKQFAASDEDDMLRIFSALKEAKVIITRLARAVCLKNFPHKVVNRIKTVAPVSHC